MATQRRKTLRNDVIHVRGAIK